MLSEKPWKPEAVLRLMLGVFICVIAGAAVLSAGRFAGGNHKIDARLFFALVACVLLCAAVALVLTRRPWPIEKFMRYFTGFLLCLYLTLILGSVIQHIAGNADVAFSTWRMIIAAISFQGSALVLIGGFLRDHQMRWSDAFGFGNDRKRALLLGGFLACGFFPIGWGLQWASAFIMSHVGINPLQQQAVQTLANADNWRDRAALAGVAIVLAPVAEEMLFRGLLYPTIKQAGFPRVALWSTALLFAAVHQNLATFVPLLALALALTMLYEETNNLLASIVAHSFFNAINFAVLYLFQNKSGS